MSFRSPPGFPPGTRPLACQGPSRYTTFQRGIFPFASRLGNSNRKYPFSYTTFQGVTFPFSLAIDCFSRKGFGTFEIDGQLKPLGLAPGSFCGLLGTQAAYGREKASNAFIRFV